MRSAILLACLTLVTVSVSRGDEREAAQLNREANRLFKDGQIEASLAAYAAALAASPNAPALRFNMANALFRLDRFEEAEAEYAAAAQAAEGDVNRSPRLSADARFNQGNTRFQAEDFKGAVELYRQVLLDSADDADARHNLEMALARLQQQQQQQQQDNQEQQDSDGEQSQQDQQQEQQQQDQKEQDAAESEESPENKDGQPEPSAATEPPSSEEQAEEQPEPADEQEEIGEEEARRLLETLSQDERRDLKDSIDRRAKKKRQAERDW